MENKPHEGSASLGQEQWSLEKRQWWKTYEDGKRLVLDFIGKLKDRHDEDPALHFLRILEEHLVDLQSRGISRDDLQNVAAYHAVIGSTLFPDSFKQGKSRADLDGDDSILHFLQTRIDELQQEK
jgi:hypothetical protein